MHCKTVESELGEWQHGLRKGSSTEDLIFTLRSIYKENGNEARMCT